MKILKRLESFSNIFIVAKLQIKKINKNDNFLLCEGLHKDGFYIKEIQEHLSANDIAKIISSYNSKMKKAAWLEEESYGESVKTETILFINPSLMEKERVGFELYGLVSARTANSNLVAYYNFADKDAKDFRQEISQTDTFGFFSLMNFESDGGLKAGLHELGVTYELIDKTENNFMFLTFEEYKRQFKKDVSIEPKREFKNKSALPPEIKKFIANEQKTEKTKVEPQKITTEKVESEEILKDEPFKKSEEQQQPSKRRGRPSKEANATLLQKNKENDNEIKTNIEKTYNKRGRGRPPKAK